MFVRRRRDRQEQEFPQNLRELGFTINDKDEVRQIDNPEKGFEYKVEKNPRLNELRREAIVGCYRKIALDRLSVLGLRPLKLSEGSHHTSITILHTPDLSRNTSRVLVLCPDHDTDLGIWSVRSIDGVGGRFSAGCMENTVSRAISEGYSVIIANPGALIYDPDLKTTITSHSWAARQKPWKLGGKIHNSPDPTWNVVKGSENPEAHVHMLFERIVKKTVPKSAKIYIIAVGESANAVAQYFDRTFDSQWAFQLFACVFAQPTYSISSLTSSNLKRHINKLARAYVVHSEPRGTQLGDPTLGCSTFSADTLYGECIIPFMYESIIDYFELAKKDPEWCNPAMLVENLVVDGKGENGIKQAMEGMEGMAQGRMWGDGSTPGCGW